MIESPNDIVRITRVLTYIGPRHRIDEVLAKGLVPGATHFGDLEVRSMIVGTPQLVPPRVPTPADKVVKVLEDVKGAKP